jgi:hypothetical protein
MSNKGSEVLRVCWNRDNIEIAVAADHNCALKIKSP